MRKIIHRYTVLLLTVLLVGTGIALADTDVVVLGDVNSDGSVTTADVTALVNYLHGSGTVNEVAADVNRDGDIDIADVTAIKNIISNGTFNKGTASTLFFPATTVEKTYGDAAFKNQLVRSGSTGAITYTSSATGVATVNTATGEVTIQAAGDATITATLAANGGISGTTASYTVNVGQATNSMTTNPVLVGSPQGYTGSPVTLVTTGGVAVYGDVEYSTTSATEGFSTTLPTATDAGEYTVWYRVPGTASYTAIDAVELGTVTISKADGAATLSTETVDFGAATANQTVTVSDNTGTVSASVTSGSGCTVSVSNTTITITRTSSSPITATITVTIAESTNNNSTTKTIDVSGSEVVFANMSTATSDDIGKVICSNGHIHSNVSDVICGGSASAMIAYVGNQNNANGNGAYSDTYNHGLAIALADVINTSGDLQTAASNKLTWENAKTACNSFKGSKPSGVTWMLPSAYQWERMLIGCGGTTNYTTSLYDGEKFSYGNFRTQLTNCGTNVQGVYDVQDYYWSSTEYSGGTTIYAWYYRFIISDFRWNYKTSNFYVRAAFAF